MRWPAHFYLCSLGAETSKNDTRNSHEGLEEEQAKTSGAGPRLWSSANSLTKDGPNEETSKNDTSTSHEGLEEDQAKTSCAQTSAVVFRKFIFVFLTPSVVSADPVDPPFGTLPILTNQQLSIPANVFESSRDRNHGAGTRNDSHPCAYLFLFSRRRYEVTCTYLFMFSRRRYAVACAYLFMFSRRRDKSKNDKRTSHEGHEEDQTKPAVRGPRLWFHKLVFDALNCVS